MDAVRELDRSMGVRMCGAAVSGRLTPGFKGLAGFESPYDLTKRTLVMPVMRGIGYGDPEYGLDGLGGVDARRADLGDEFHDHQRHQAFEDHFQRHEDRGKDGRRLVFADTFCQCLYHFASEGGAAARKFVTTS